MNTQNLPDAVKNQSLFSNYYLDSLIIEQPQWTDTPNIESDYEAIKQRFDAIVPNAENLNEAQTEEQFIRPLLRKLGHVFEVQPTLQTSQGTRVPDYAFFASADALNAAQPHINTNQFFRTALAVGDAKKWSRNLDRKTQDESDPFNNQNPNYQIDFYLRSADKDWGILTNGRQWRLHHRQTSYRLDNFYEVDLAALLSENGDLDAFRYFYCLFRHGVFITYAREKSFLDHVLGESQEYTVAVSNDLKNRVYDTLDEIVDFGELPVFEDAAAMPAIFSTLRESVDAQTFRFTQMQTLDFDSLEGEIDRIGEQLDQDALGENWTLAPADEIRILNRIRENSTTLTRYCEGKVRRSLITGFNEAFIIDGETRDYLINEDPRSAEIIKPCIIGDDIRKYEIQFRERYLIWTYIGVPIEQYPAVFNHLRQFEGTIGETAGSRRTLVGVKKLYLLR